MDRLFLFHERSRIHHLPRQSERWRVDQCTIFQLFTDRLVSEGSPDCFMYAFLKYIAATPHVRLPLSVSLGYGFDVIRWSGCLELFLNPAWSAHWHRSSTARSRLYSIVERGVLKGVEDHRLTCSSLDLSRLLSCRSLWSMCFL